MADVGQIGVSAHIAGISPGYLVEFLFFTLSLVFCAQWCQCLCIVLSWLPLWFSVTFIYSVFIRSLWSHRLMDHWLIIFIPVQMKLLSPRVCGMPGPDRKHDIGKSENKNWIAISWTSSSLHRFGSNTNRSEHLSPKFILDFNDILN